MPNSGASRATWGLENDRPRRSSIDRRGRCSPGRPGQPVVKETTRYSLSSVELGLGLLTIFLAMNSLPFS